MRMAERKFKDSFREAGAGIWYCVVSQRNMKIHLLATIIVLIASWLLGLNFCYYSGSGSGNV